ncbi:TetR family transcriptional regulator [Virgisporangium aliadipatigenens]|uniref:TetR family transcriptional regulator n=1 Tax=Virgisporangium aliadipatigenens TaxID=741659 RepID=A0A8J3YN39_9ACTN|nr:TetR/AcrR family transcriptional regulator [Virgisporangium aliadipatigenens]GIJ46733.1 TetR family transcriptional regulator [Virgisporangium aliadipatigenens]
MTQPAVGRRERKKAATRQAIADAALRLFLAHGYDRVSVRDIADAADVSTTTLFKHFPGKEALVFDRDDEREAGLVAAVRERPPGTDVLDALRAHVHATWLPLVTDPRLAGFTELVNNTPALREYSARMWRRRSDALSAAIAEEFGVPRDHLACVALARFVLEIPALTRDRPDPAAAVDEIFDILTNGWRPPV